VSTEQPGPQGPEWLGRWWRETARPLLVGCGGGFLLAMLVMGLLEAAGVPSEGAAEPAWFDSAVALTFFGGWVGLYALLSTRARGGLRGWRRARPEVAAGRKQGVVDEVHAQVQRIEEKARKLRQEAGRRAPYRDLAGQAPELAAQARKLAGQVARLRKAAGEAAQNRPMPDLPSGPADLPETGQLGAEYRAAEAAQQRLEELLAANVAQQQLCLTRLERIEDLLDGARLEVSRPEGLNVDGAAPRSSMVDDMETELRAAREAMTETEGRER
jgi:hypothetical protein